MTITASSRARRALTWGAAGAGVLALLAGGVLAATAGAAAPEPAAIHETATVPPELLPEVSAAPRLAETPASTPTPETDESTPELAPDTLSIPSIGVVEMPVASVDGFEPGRIEGTQQLVLPADAGIAGHWTPAADLADDPDGGTTLVAAHVVWNGVWSPLRALGEVQSGTVIHTTDADGEAMAWQVESVEHRPKLELPQELFTPEAATGPRRLVVVTCGGPVQDSRHTENVIVTAVPAR